jgi:CPA2 family monovalent cation:H+ antiporter-2
VILSESELAHQAGNDSLPLKDAFAVLFFVSVGMLFDPTVLVRQPLAVLAVLAIIMIGKSVAAFVIVLVFRHPVRTALTVSAQPGTDRRVLLHSREPRRRSRPAARGWARPDSRRRHPVHRAESRRLRGRDAADALGRIEAAPAEGIGAPGAELHRTPVSSASGLRHHAIVIGYGRVGGAIGQALKVQGLPFSVIERDHLMLASAQAAGVPTVVGDAAVPGVLEAAGLEHARLVVVATPDSFQARRIVELAQKHRAGIDIVVRTHSENELKALEQLKVGHVVLGERELAHGMLEYALRSLGVPAERARAAAGRGAPVNPEGT